MRNLLLGLALIAGTAAPGLAQSPGPQPGLNERGLPPAYDRDAILPNNTREMPESTRQGGDAPVGGFGNPAPGGVYIEPAPGLGPQPVDPMSPDYPDYPPQ